ncbi:MAG: DUF4139 domain-containing protein [Candidatus Latescibacteria bacterium]|nr:DUF4139 domain-containing protein [Candidatus Latescibacterota bacterium]
MTYSKLLGIAALAGSALVGGSADAADLKSTPADQKSLSITIYNDNLGLVKDVRVLDLKSGTQSLWFQGVAAHIDPTTVHIRSVDAPDALVVIEQNFEYDLVSPERLMQKYIGQTVELVTMREGRDDETIRAKLIGTQGGTVYELENGKIAINPPGRVVLPALPAGLISEPSLVWLLDAGKTKQTVEASYLTGGIGWRSDYVAVLSADDAKADLSGWVTIDNQSGATYENASLKLVAGDINRARPEYPAAPAMADMAVRSLAKEEQFREESFFEYHLYALERKATVKDRQTKQISLLSAEGAKVKKTFVVQPQYAYWFARAADIEKPKVGVYVSLDNSKKNGMGMPLPKGIVRVYKKDSKSELQFIGEDRIDHTPEDETIRIKMGDAFDVIAERVQTNFEVLSSGHLYRSSYKVTLRNHKAEDITVQVIELMSGDWAITASSYPHVKEASHRARFDVPVKSKGSAELTYTAEIRY